LRTGFAGLLRMLWCEPTADWKRRWFAEHGRSDHRRQREHGRFSDRWWNVGDGRHQRQGRGGRRSSEWWHIEQRWEQSYRRPRRNRRRSCDRRLKLFFRRDNLNLF
jgi:hypothetical protein